MAHNGELYEIFSRLPAKPLHILSTMAKPCLEYLHETPFMEKQCLNSLSKRDVGFFMEKDSCLRSLEDTTQLVALPGHNGLVGVPDESLEFLKNNGRILASSNGLLLCRTIIDSTKPTELFLCNPVTKTWLPIALPTIEMSKRCHFCDINAVLLIGYGDGGDSSEKKFPLDYNLLVFDYDYMTEEWPRSTNVYELDNKGEWVARENVNVGGRDLKFDSPVYCKDNGLYLLSSTGNYINKGSPYYWPYVFCYDVQVGKSKILDLPENARNNFMKGNMGIFGWQWSEGNNNTTTTSGGCFDSICLVKVTSLTVEVWVLEDSNNSNWRQVTNLHIVENLGIKDQVSSEISFMIMGNNNLVFATDEYIYCYCLEGKDIGSLQKICKNSCGSSSVRFTSYSSTLRPCADKQTLQHHHSP